MKKGFTLIELLAVIVILAIILLIAIPQVLEIIDEVKIKAYQDNEEMLVKGAKSYLAANPYEYPKNVGDTKEIHLTDLSTIISETTYDGDSCDGYILITKTDDDYIYTPELRCGEVNTIGDSTTDELVAYYTFDNNFYDSSLNKLHATNYGTNPDWFVEDRHGIAEAAVNFSGDYYNYLESPMISVNTNLSICAWINPKRYLTGYETIVVGRTSGSFYLSLGNEGEIASYWYGTAPSGYHESIPGSALINQWSFACTVWDGAYNYIYVNGEEANKVAVVGAGNVSTLIHIGAESSTRQLEGAIDDLKIYSRALSGKEIKLMYNTSK